jgi:hypothetical protein
VKWGKRSSTSQNTANATKGLIFYAKLHKDVDYDAKLIILYLHCSGDGNGKKDGKDIWSDIIIVARSKVVWSESWLLQYCILYDGGAIQQQSVLFSPQARVSITWMGCESSGLPLNPETEVRPTPRRRRVHCHGSSLNARDPSQLRAFRVVVPIARPKFLPLN